MTIRSKIIRRAVAALEGGPLAMRDLTAAVYGEAASHRADAQHALKCAIRYHSASLAEHGMAIRADRMGSKARRELVRLS